MHHGVQRGRKSRCRGANGREATQHQQFDACQSQSEYQKSYGVSRSRSVSPRRCLPLAGISREPGLQRLKRPSPLGANQSSSSLLGSPEDPGAPRRAPSASRNGSKSCSAHKNPPSTDSRPPKVSGSAQEPESLAGPQPVADLEPPPRPEPGSSLRPVIDEKSVKLHPSEPEPSRPVTAVPEDQPDNQVDQVLRWKAGMRSGGQRSGAHRSEYHRQFGWKKPVLAASPLLTAEQVLYSSSRSVPAFKKNPVSMETEYRRSFQGLLPPSGPRLLEHQGAPLFHTYRIQRRKSLEPQKKLPPKLETTHHENSGSQSPPRTLPPAAQVQKRHRNPEGGDTDDIAEQVKELRQQALTYQQRAWGTNFSRNHLSQLLSEYNALWEPTDTMDSHTESSTPRLNVIISPELDSRSASCVEALDLASISSKRSSVGSGGTRHEYKKTQRSTRTETPPGPGAERQAACGGEDDDDEEEEGERDDFQEPNPMFSASREEGRLPTPRLKTRPVQRTHHDLTTPATGGAILVGKLTNADDSSPHKQKQKFGTAVSQESGLDDAVKPTKLKQAWSENTPTSLSPFPPHKQTPSPQLKPARTKQESLSPAAPTRLTSAQQHGIQGMLRHPDFQHNGELGLRFRELPCSRGGCGSDEDDRLSVMSWRSVASCSAASAVLERAQKRRDNFWGKR
ncbi:nuclear protein MDM1 isoform X3 [Girardinichthys multiradiatus]|uniref:nuclear protein MDM1 isoform X3 n=1 Tax=Girardinichthys multiradiatus TaxID=208333 RepID=UPI001FAB4C55|nr:nuclear protein MDM1 isoform X3 [Girardinichthys multiradiatus]